MTELTKKKTPFMISLTVILMLIVSPAYAIFPKLSTDLTGSAIGGVTPNGKASVDQSSYPTVPVFVTVMVTKVNVPNGTVVAVNISDCVSYGPVAHLTIVNKTASLGTYLPSFCQVGRLSSITITNGTQVLLSGGNPWKI